MSSFYKKMRSTRSSLVFVKPSLLSFMTRSHQRLQKNVVYLGRPIAPSYISPNAGERGVAGSQPMSTAVHRSPNKLWISNSIFVKIDTHVHNYEHGQIPMVTDLRRRPVMGFLYLGVEAGGVYRWAIGNGGQSYFVC
jgi:hypothetical protein